MLIFRTRVCTVCIERNWYFFSSSSDVLIASSTEWIKLRVALGLPWQRTICGVRNASINPAMAKLAQGRNRWWKEGRVLFDIFGGGMVSLGLWKWISLVMRHFFVAAITLTLTLASTTLLTSSFRKLFLNFRPRSLFWFHRRKLPRRDVTHEFRLNS